MRLRVDCCPRSFHRKREPRWTSFSRSEAGLVIRSGPTLRHRQGIRLANTSEPQILHELALADAPRAGFLLDSGCFVYTLDHNMPVLACFGSAEVRHVRSQVALI